MMVIVFFTWTALLAFALLYPPFAESDLANAKYMWVVRFAMVGTGLTIAFILFVLANCC